MWTCRRIPSSNTRSYAGSSLPRRTRQLSSASSLSGNSKSKDAPIASTTRLPVPQHLIAVELDGFEFHSSRPAFSYDRLRQNDIHATGRVVIRFSYDSIRRDTRRCVEQLQAMLALDPLLARFVVADPVIEQPEMDPDPLFALQPSPEDGVSR